RVAGGAARRSVSRHIASLRPRSIDIVSVQTKRVQSCIVMPDMDTDVHEELTRDVLHSSVSV
ncbi:hypothetical protein NY486_02150, partial [Enterobacter hormaechei]|nr:hypothetical protein [Enterobacter hormaechei]